MEDWRHSRAGTSIPEDAKAAQRAMAAAAMPKVWTHKKKGKQGQDPIPIDAAPGTREQEVLSVC